MTTSSLGAVAARYAQAAQRAEKADGMTVENAMSACWMNMLTRDKDYVAALLAEEVKLLMPEILKKIRLALHEDLAAAKKELSKAQQESKP
jgi:hypothetical protein